MSYRILKYQCIKSKSGAYQLPRRVLVTGPNESGKTAFLEAFRLAVTGVSGLGARGFSKLMNTTSAKASVEHSEGTFVWEGKKSSQHTAPFDAQAAMPVTVDEFWGLTSVGRMQLIASGGATLQQLSAKEEELVKEQKRLNTIISRPGVPSPDVYDGPSVSSLEEKLAEIGQKVAMHRNYMQSKKANEAAREAASLSIQSTQKEVDTLKTLIESNSRQLSEAERLLGQVAPLCQAYRDAIEERPALLSKAHCISAFNGWRDSFVESLQWIKDNGGSDRNVPLWMQTLQRLPEIQEMPIPEVQFDGSAELKELGHHQPDADSLLQERVDKLAEEKERLARDLDKAHVSLRTNEKLLEREDEIKGARLETEEYERLVVEHEASQALLKQAGAWEQYSEMASKEAKERGDAQVLLDKVEGDLVSVRQERAEETRRLKEPVESLANEMLTKAGMPPLEVSIVTTPKTAKLEVSTGDVHIDALADSRKLLYGICLVSAIQDCGDATDPILLARCAEMDNAMLQRTVNALELRKKGAVVLEHWSASGISGIDVIDLSAA